jgi:hypothetical protein
VGSLICIYTIKQSRRKWIVHILCRNCHLKHIIQGKTQGTRRRGRRFKQLLDDLKEMRSYWNLKKEALSGKLALEKAANLSEDTV